MRKTSTYARKIRRQPERAQCKVGKRCAAPGTHFSHQTKEDGASTRRDHRDAPRPHITSP